MTTDYRLLDDWLAAEAGRRVMNDAVEIPVPAMSALASFLASDHVGEEALNRCQATLSTLFRHYQKPVYAHEELVGAVLLKLGTLSQKHFWLAALDFIRMVPGLGDNAIRQWLRVLQLSAEDEQMYRTELFHAHR